MKQEIEELENCINDSNKLSNDLYYGIYYKNISNINIVKDKKMHNYKYLYDLTLKLSANETIVNEIMKFYEGHNKRIEICYSGIKKIVQNFAFRGRF